MASFKAIILKQDWEQELPWHWCDNSAFKTHFLNALSLVLPDCEKFFIGTTKPYLKSIKDQEQTAEVLEFIRQEGYHRYAHIKYNQWLERGGLPVTSLGRSTNKAWRFANQILSDKQKLALTICIEHITVVCTAMLLSNKELFDQMDPHFRKIWQYHSVEEIEHKAVTMNLWNLAGGSERMKRFFMLLALPLYIYYVAKHALVFLHADGVLFHRKTWTDAISFLFNQQTGLIRRCFVPWLDIMKPGFHPDDHDHTDLLDTPKIIVDRP